MTLSVGLLGLPNVGKSSTFNALVKAQNAQSDNYAFCTIEPNKAIVPLKDKRLEELAKIVNPQKIQYSNIEFVDIAGLVKGASKGEGLGNKFLSNIREVEVLLHIVRCFDDDDIIHVDGSVDVLRDISTIDTELIFADLEQLEKKIVKLQKEAKFDNSAKDKLEGANKLKEHLEAGEPVRVFDDLDDEAISELIKELRLLSAKEVIFGANIGEDDLGCEDNKYVKELKEFAKKQNAQVVSFCAKIEEELIGLDDEESMEILNDYGIKESSLDVIISACFDKLGLCSYFTAGVVEVRSWTIKKNALAPDAAAAIHNDFKKGFIKAEVIAYEDFIKYGGEEGAKNAGKMRLEGKEYQVKDGDIMHFKFNV